MTCSSITRTQKALLCFGGKNGYTNAPQCYIIRTVPILFFTTFLINPRVSGNSAALTNKLVFCDCSLKKDFLADKDNGRIKIFV